MLCILFIALANGPTYAQSVTCDECGECHEGPSKVDEAGDCAYCYKCYEGRKVEQSRKFVGVLNKLDWLIDNLSVTCDECRKLDKERARAQLDLSRKERHMEKAFKKKEFRRVTELREEMTELRRTLLKFKGKGLVCKCACRPDVVKAAVCKTLVREIVALDKEGLTAKADREKIDEKYAELAMCNREMRELRKIYMKCLHKRRKDEMN